MWPFFFIVCWGQPPSRVNILSESKKIYSYYKGLAVCTQKPLYKIPSALVYRNGKWVVPNIHTIENWWATLGTCAHTSNSWHDFHILGDYSGHSPSDRTVRLSIQHPPTHSPPNRTVRLPIQHPPPHSPLSWFPQLLLWLNTYCSEMQAFPREKSREITEEAQLPLLPLPHTVCPTFSTVSRLTCCCPGRFLWCWSQTCPYGRPVLEQKGCKKDVLPAILGACNTHTQTSQQVLTLHYTEIFHREHSGHLFQPAVLEVRMLCSCLAHYFHRFSGKTETWKLFIDA